MTFVPASPLAEVPDGGAVAVEVEGVELALVRDGDVVYAVVDECSHAAIPLSEGEVEGNEIECWLHGSRFDLRTGKPVNLPATTPISVYPVKIDGGDVFVSVTKEN